MTKRRWIVLGGVVLAGVVALGIGLGRDRRTADGDPGSVGGGREHRCLGDTDADGRRAGESVRSAADRDAGALRQPAAGSREHRQAARDR